MMLITTSRKPGRRTRSFCKDLASAIPLAKYVNRGKGNIYDMVERALAQGFQRLLIVGETKGNPSIIRTVEVKREPRWGIQLYITGVKLCREIGCDQQEGDYVEVRGDYFGEALEKVFAWEGEGIPVIVEEKASLVRFLFEDRVVGPIFRVRGWDPVPNALRRQSSLKR